jgi:predicted N-acetyltransferase YhbS
MSDPIAGRPPDAIGPCSAYAETYSSRAPTASDQAQLDALHDAAFGPGALTRTAYRIREGMSERSPYCRVIEFAGQIIAMARFTPVLVGGRGGAVMVGPVAVDASHANRGLARRLIAEGLDAARAAGQSVAILVGDPPYYARIGFVPVAPGRIVFPGPVDPARLLAIELQPGALQRYGGMVAGDRP